MTALLAFSFWEFEKMGVGGRGGGGFESEIDGDAILR